MPDPEKLAENWRNPDGTLKEGHPPMGGRPKGKTLKEFARELLMTMNDEEKKAYLATLPKDIVWKMAEGNPHQDTFMDHTSKGDKIVFVPPELLNKHEINEDTGDSTPPQSPEPNSQ